MSTPTKSRIPRSGLAIVIPEHVARRALDRYTEDQNGCHISLYSTGSHGYAQIGWNSEGGRFGSTAHRAAWTAIHGQIPLGMTIDHLCHVRQCVNPGHLRLLANSINAADNGQLCVNPLTDRLCHKGHPLALSSTGSSYCRTCIAARKRSARARGAR